MEINNNVSKRQIAFERAQYFLAIKQNKPQNMKKEFKEKRDKYSTLKDSDLTDYSTEVELKNNININTVRENDQVEINTHMKQHSIKIDKKLIKYAEPRLKLQTSIQIPQKFNYSYSNRNSLTHSLSGLVETENDLLEIDEKLPQSKLEMIEAKKSIIIQEEFDFSYIIKTEEIYSELIKEFKENGLSKNEFKEKLGADYYEVSISEDNKIANVFQYNQDINKFLSEELCYFLIIMFFNELEELTENELFDFKSILEYIHINFLYAVSFIISNYDKITKGESTNFNKCKDILNKYSINIENNKLSDVFKSKNKIIKQLIKTLLSEIQWKNKENLKLIKTILSNYKKVKFIHTKFSIQKNEMLINKNKEIKSKVFSNQNEEDGPEGMDNEDEGEKPKPPFLNPKKEDDKREYTLILDLDETLVHYFEDEKDNGAYVKVRMDTENFIDTLSQYCEIVIFTASTQYYADTVIEGLDCKNKIDYRLYRKHTTNCDGINIKDLSKLGRDMSKMIIIDNIEENYQLQPKNGLNIYPFEGDENDCELKYLLKDLLEIVTKPDLDVRNCLDDVRNKMNERYSKI